MKKKIINFKQYKEIENKVKQMDIDNNEISKYKDTSKELYKKLSDEINDLYTKEQFNEVKKITITCSIAILVTALLLNALFSIPVMIIAFIITCNNLNKIEEEYNYNLISLNDIDRSIKKEIEKAETTLEKNKELEKEIQDKYIEINEKTFSYINDENLSKPKTLKLTYNDKK